MASPCEEEEENYIRLGLLLTGITPRAVRSLFDTEFSPAVLQSTLKKEYKTLLDMYQRRIINKTQLSILSAKPDSMNFDISLMICLLTNITPIPGYNRLPSPTDTSKGADLARIKHYRNVQAHLNDSRVDNSYFVAAWDDMTNVLGRLGGSGIRQECIYLRTKVLDKSNQEIIREIKSSQDEIDILKHELEDVKAKLNTIDQLSKDVIPQPLKGLIKEQLESWLKDDNTFVTTRAVDKILASLQTNSFVIVTGHSGVGKTFAARHAALEFHQLGYIIIPTSKPEDIVNVYNKVPKTLFVIDDLCGHYTLNQQYLDNFKQILNDIKILLKTGCKIIATCRLQVFKDERFIRLSALNYTECNISSKDVCLTGEEKENLAKQYAINEKDKFIEIYNEFDCFPLLCYLLSKDKKRKFPIFLKNPFDCFEDEFHEFLYGGQITGQYKSCALCLIAMFDNKLEERYLSNDTSSKEKMIKDTLVKCKLNEGTSLVNINDALKTLDGSLVVKNKNVYSIIHDKMFDFVAYYFGQKMLDLFIIHSDSKIISERLLWKSSNTVKENVEFTIILPDNMLSIYVERLILDWKQGHVLDVFLNRNMANLDFRKEFLSHVLKLNRTNQLILASMIDCDNGLNSLLYIVASGDIHLTQWILDCFITDSTIGHSLSAINQSTKDGISPFLFACYDGDLTILNMLIKCKADVNQCSKDGESSVFLACQYDHLETLNRLIECKADVNKCREDGASPVYIACREGHLEILNKLIDCRADVNKCRENGESPVYIACQNGHLQILNILIEYKADINKCCKNGVSPVYIACQEGHLDILNQLLECKADINKCHVNGMSPVYVACQYGHVQILNRLIECKADVNKCCVNGISPLYIACHEGFLEIVNRLIECNADIMKCSEDGISPVSVACYIGRLDILNKLIENKADINKCDNNGVSPIHISCESGCFEIFDRLVECKADLHDYTTLVDIALKNDSFLIAEILMQIKEES